MEGLVLVAVGRAQVTDAEIGELRSAARFVVSLDD
jgi:hypothetical protein